MKAIVLMTCHARVPYSRQWWVILSTYDTARLNDDIILRECGHFASINVR